MNLGSLNGLKFQGAQDTAAALTYEDNFGTAWQAANAVWPLRLKASSQFNIPTIQQRTIILGASDGDEFHQVLYAEGSRRTGLLLAIIDGKFVASGWDERSDDWLGTSLIGPVARPNVWSSVALRLDGDSAQIADGLSLWVNGEVVAQGLASQLTRRSESTPRR